MADAMNLEVLKFAVESGIINIDTISCEVNKMKRSELLKEHKYAVWHGSDGKWHTYIDVCGERKPRKRNTKEEIENIIVEYMEKCKSMTLRQLYCKWLPYKDLHTDASTYARRINFDWKKYYEHDKIADMNVQDMTYLQLDAWAHNLIKQHNLTKKQYYNATIIIRQCLDYACEPELNCLTENPFKKVKIKSNLFLRKRKPESRTQVYLNSEQQKVADEINRHYHENPRHITAMAVLLNFQLGLRVGELVALKWDDVEGNYIHVQRMEVKRFKLAEKKGMVVTVASGCDVAEYTKSSASDRKVYLNTAARDILQNVKKTCMRYDCFNDDGFIFVPERGSGRIRAATVNYYLLRMCDKIGILPKSNHKIRKTYISSMFDAGINVDTIREQAGHEDERTSLNNYCFDRNDDYELERKLESVSNGVVKLSI